MKKMMPMVLMAVIIIVSLVFAIQGIQMHTKVNMEEAKFHELQASYWNLDKPTREGAATSSELQKQLVEIKNYPSELMKLKLIGVGKILIGIYALLFGILIALMMMPIKLGKIINKK